MQVRNVQLYVIEMPLKKPFETHLETVSKRESIIVELTDDEGRRGYGEVVAFSTPWYTEETVITCYHMLKDLLVPIVLNREWTHPNELTSLFSAIKGNRMAKAGIETAIWDLFAKSQQAPLFQVLGGNRATIPAGVAIGTTDVKAMLRQIETYLDEGYQRIKLKIIPNQEYEMLSKVRQYFPDAPIMIDANGAYSFHDDVDRLKALDDFGLLMIEQPFGNKHFIEHAKLQEQIKTPICLDESIASIEDVKLAIQLNSCRLINIKVGRVGGLAVAKAIHDYCLAEQVGVWCGGMLEFGVSRAHNIALSTLEGFQIPGDLSASRRYWEQDIIEPEVEIDHGKIYVPTTPGIGFEINKKRLKQVCTYNESFLAK
ncbi:o-succinylbenzoate synthase [Aeribacillus pallidus]|uniref:o-succinylbenzoate synthase n=1 Tax=Aeribacillus pallidus TaxID=33936 RepID=UPI003D26120C